jgi:predicted secreted protein
MAQRTAEGKNLVLLIDTLNTGSSYDLVVCLTSNSFARTANVIDASSKCGTEKINGVKDRTIALEGTVQFDPSVGKLSEGDLNDIFENDTRVAWLFGPETPVAGDYYYTGTDALLSDLTLDAPNDGAATFTGTLQLSGVPVRTVEGS